MICRPTVDGLACQCRASERQARSRVVAARSLQASAYLVFELNDAQWPPWGRPCLDEVLLGAVCDEVIGGVAASVAQPDCVGARVSCDRFAGRSFQSGGDQERVVGRDLCGELHDGFPAVKVRGGVRSSWPDTLTATPYTPACADSGALPN